MFFVICFLSLLLTACYKTSFSPSKPETLTGMDYFFTRKDRYEKKHYTRANINNIKNQDKNEVYLTSKSNIAEEETAIMKSYVESYNKMAEIKQIEYLDGEKDKNGFGFNMKKYPDGNMKTVNLLFKKNIMPMPIYLRENFKKYNEYVKKREKLERENKKTLNELGGNNWNYSYVMDIKNKQYKEKSFND